MSDFIQYRFEDGIVTLTLCAPEQHNALSHQVQFDGFTEICVRINRDPQVKVVILTGAGKMLKSGGNLLLLDEPTNDLDVETLRSLEDALLSFAGCAVVISHDRWFLDRIATHILAFEGDSKAFFFEGNFEDYEADKKKRLGPDALEPHRIRYRPLQKN